MIDARINAIYKEWLRATIQEDVPYRLDPGEGVVTEDLNNFSGLKLTWQEWDIYYRENKDFIIDLEKDLEFLKSIN